MTQKRNMLVWAYWLITAGLFAGMVVMVFMWTPDETSMGPVQKIFYFHLPVAINAFVACFITFIAGIGYLWQRRTVWDDLGVSAAKMAVMLCSIVLITGMLWGRQAWGKWWTWSPRLTFSLLLWLLYVVYLTIRPSIESRQRRSLVSAVYGVVAFLDVPLVYLSVKLMPDIHPSSITLAPQMKMTLGLSFIPVTLLVFGLLFARFRLQRRQTALATVPEDETAPVKTNPDSPAGESSDADARPIGSLR